MRQAIDSSLSPSLSPGKPESTRTFFYAFKFLVPYLRSFIKKIMKDNTSLRPAKLHSKKQNVTKKGVKTISCLTNMIFFSGF